MREKRICAIIASADIVPETYPAAANGANISNTIAIQETVKNPNAQGACPFFGYSPMAFPPILKAMAGISHQHKADMNWTMPASAVSGLELADDL